MSEVIITSVSLDPVFLTPLPQRRKSDLLEPKYQYQAAVSFRNIPMIVNVVFLTTEEITKSEVVEEFVLQALRAEFSQLLHSVPDLRSFLKLRYATVFTVDDFRVLNVSSEDGLLKKWPAVA